TEHVEEIRGSVLLQADLELADGLAEHGLDPFAVEGLFGVHGRMGVADLLEPEEEEAALGPPRLLAAGGVDHEVLQGALEEAAEAALLGAELLPVLPLDEPREEVLGEVLGVLDALLPGGAKIEVGGLPVEVDEPL